MYVFGDSLVDAGNNNFLPPPAPRALPPNCIDLPRTVLRRTGRFTNGYNLADIIGTLPPLQCLLPPLLRRGDGDPALSHEILRKRAESFRQNLLN
jgi:hypothetical protein